MATIKECYRIRSLHLVFREKATEYCIVLVPIMNINWCHMNSESYNGINEETVKITKVVY